MTILFSIMRVGQHDVRKRCTNLKRFDGLLQTNRSEAPPIVETEGLHYGVHLIADVLHEHELVQVVRQGIAGLTIDMIIIELSAADEGILLSNPKFDTVDLRFRVDRMQSCLGISEMLLMNDWREQRISHLTRFSNCLCRRHPSILNANAALLDVALDHHLHRFESTWLTILSELGFWHQAEDRSLGTGCMSLDTATNRPNLNRTEDPV